MAGKLIEFSKGSSLYFRLGNYYYDKNNLDRALRFFERAAAVDPANPANQFNLACLLSELGQYQRSTKIFQGIVQDNSDYSESWFWMAMNSGQQQQYREASYFLCKYLEQDPNGDYRWQAEEILTYLDSDLPMLSDNKRKRIEELCLQGLEQISLGQLQQAIAYFSKASDIEPELILPRNNLALVWFQLGEVDNAIAVTREVLERRPQNIVANCNLAAFLRFSSDEVALRRQVQVLNGLWSDNPDEMVKLATTYGLLGLHRRAMYLLRELREGLCNYEVLLLLGIATYNCGYIAEAASIFEQANNMEPQSPYAVYRQYCDTGKGKIPYHLRTPNSAIAAIIEGNASPEKVKALKKPEIWPQLLWVIERSSTLARRRLCSAVLEANYPQLIDLLASSLWRGVGRWQRDVYNFLLEGGVVPWRSLGRCKELSPGAAAVLEGIMEILGEQGYGYLAQAVAHECWTTYWTRFRPPVRNRQLWIAALLVFVQGLENLEDTAAEFGLIPDRLAAAVQKLTTCI